MKISNRYSQYLLIAFLSLLITYFVNKFYTDSILHFWQSYPTILIGTVVVWEINKVLVIYLRKRVSWRSYAEQHIILQGAGSVLIAVTITFFVLLFLFKFIYKEKINYAIVRQVLGSVILLTLMLNAFFETLYFYNKWRLNFVKNEILRRESLRTRFESLKHQVNPHFLFNSLNTLTTLIEEDHPETERFVDELTEVYRYVLDSKKWQLVTLEKELNFVNTYMFLQRMRFGNNVVLTNNIKEECKLMHLLPPLTIQLLVENAIKHNIVSKDKPLYLSIDLVDDYVFICNNLQKKSNPSMGNTGIGLRNIKARYSYLTNKEVIIEQLEKTFCVKIPILENSEIINEPEYNISKV